VLRGREENSLSALEFKLMRHLIEHRGELITRDELLRNVWAYDGAAQTRTVDVHIASPRNKVEAIPSRPEFIVTVHSMGYRFLG
jgi:DNA-binding response OmpR family regulator